MNLFIKRKKNGNIILQKMEKFIKYCTKIIYKVVFHITEKPLLISIAMK